MVLTEQEKNKKDLINVYKNQIPKFDFESQPFLAALKHANVDIGGQGFDIGKPGRREITYLNPFAIVDI